jgi:addiction module HigA family antidote
MEMFNPPHPGKFISETYVSEMNISGRELAKHLDVSPSTLNRILLGKSGITPDMALRLSAVLGRTPESWLAMQDQYDLWQAKQRINLDRFVTLVCTHTTCCCITQ